MFGFNSSESESSKACIGKLSTTPPSTINLAVFKSPLKDLISLSVSSKITGLNKNGMPIDILTASATHRSFHFPSFLK